MKTLFKLLVERGSLPVFLAAMFVVAHPYPSSAQAEPSEPQIFSLDLSSYDCTSLKSLKDGKVTHLGQVIQSTYYEWYQYQQSPAAGGRLACVSLVRPSERTLSAKEAGDFITSSANVGAPSGTPASINKQDEKSSALPAAPFKDVAPPFPLPSVIKPDHAQSTPEHAAATSSQPPFPAQTRNPAADLFSEPLPETPATSVPAVPSSVQTFQAERPKTLGVDDRIKVISPASAYPYNTIGYLFITFPNGKSGSCTGTLISPYVVLTAGHCVHNNTNGGWATQAAFYPGQDQSAPGQAPIRPYGGHSDWKWLHTTSGWTAVSGPDSHSIADYEHDYAAIQFATPFTYTTTFMPVVFNDTNNANNAGYPGEVGGTSSNLAMWRGFGNEDSTSLSVYRLIHVREFQIDSSPGDSGGPFWTFNGTTNQRAFVGTLSYGDPVNDYAGGPWYDGWNQSLLTSWITWTPATDSQTSALPSIAGLRVPTIFGSAQQGSQSFVRLFNSSSQSGTVEITLADTASGQPLGKWTSPTIPPLSEQQFSIATIEAGANTPVKPQSYYSFSVRPTFNGSFQHVLWNTGNGSLTNMTMCDSKVTSNPTLLFGVHSSLISAGYPSYIVVHNTDLNSTTVTLGVYDANTGAKLGTITTPSINGNGQYIQSVVKLEGLATPALHPSSATFHYIFKVESSFHGSLQHFVNNTATGVVTDLSSSCGMTPAPGQ